MKFLLLLSLLLSAQSYVLVTEMTNNQKRIIFGEDLPTSYEDESLHVTLRIGLGGCQGVLLRPTIVLTAAHCFDNLAHKLAESARMGIESGAMLGRVTYASTLDLYLDTIVPLVSVIRHPGYNRDQSDHHRINNDLALVKLRSPLATENATAALKILSNPKAGSSCYMIGYSESNSHAIRKNRMKFSLATRETCSTVLRYENIAEGFTNEDNLLCAVMTGRGACHGDSGAGIMCENADGKYQLAGILGAGDYNHQPGLLHFDCTQVRKGIGSSMAKLALWSTYIISPVLRQTDPFLSSPCLDRLATYNGTQLEPTFAECGLDGLQIITIIVL